MKNIIYQIDIDIGKRRKNTIVSNWVTKENGII